MKSKRKKTIKIFLELDAKEAEILKTMVQNTRYDQIEKEPSNEKNLRYELFKTLKEQLEN